MSSREKIVRLLRDHCGEYLSGQEISNALKISRAAVWKQIEQLRAAGFEIDARRAQGYCLQGFPDVLLADEILAGLATKVVGRQVNCVKQLNSTNLTAREAAGAGAREGLVVLADHQSSGRGRLGRNWASPEGVNIYCSVLLRPQLPPPDAPQLTFLSAVATAEVLDEVCGLNARVKWPNDVLINGKKIAGLLNELGAETEQIHFLVLGIGINVNMAADQFPADLRYPATSVMLETGSTQARLPLVRALLRRIDELYHDLMIQGFGPLRRRWEARFDLLDRQVEVDQGQQVVRGVVAGLDADGALRLLLPDGRSERILAGDVRPVDR
jgi:BirA family biotin operon repressor/biotin-[acetyl-CoA-carboxylase] ligase